MLFPLQGPTWLKSSNGFIMWALIVFSVMNFYMQLSAQSVEREKSNKRYNIRTGALKLNLAGTFSVEYNDNITSTGSNQKSDLILRPGISVEGEWHVSDINVLSLKVGASYSKYLKNTELDSSRNLISFDRDSNLEFVVRMSPVTVTFSDTFYFTADPTDAFAVNDDGSVSKTVDSFSRLYNTFKVDTLINLQDININLVLSRLDTVPFGTRFQFLRKTEYQEYAHITFIIESTLILGLKGGLKQNKYKQNFNNDSTGFFFGPTLEWKMTRLLSTKAEVLFSKTNFENNGENEDTSQSQTIDARINFQHRMNRRYTHSLTLSHLTSSGSISNTTTVNKIDYYWAWRAFKRTTLKGNLAHERSKDSGGISPENFNRNMASIEFAYRLTKKSTMSFLYAYSKKDSNLEDRSFINNRAVVSFVYDF